VCAEACEAAAKTSHVDCVALGAGQGLACRAHAQAFCSPGSYLSRSCAVDVGCVPAVLRPALLQAKPGVKLHMLGETVDGHDLDVLQVSLRARAGGWFPGVVRLYCKYTQLL
jgi:hypothetical protein